MYDAKCKLIFLTIIDNTDERMNTLVEAEEMICFVLEKTQREERTVSVPPAVLEE